jgi:hypothetical protein
MFFFFLVKVSIVWNIYFSLFLVMMTKLMMKAIKVKSTIVKYKCWFLLRCFSCDDSVVSIYNSKFLIFSFLIVISDFGKWLLGSNSRFVMLSFRQKYFLMIVFGLYFWCYFVLIVASTQALCIQSLKSAAFL